MSKNAKKFTMAIIALAFIVNVFSCSENAEIPKSDIFEREIFQFNNVFTNGFVFESEGYVYFIDAKKDKVDDGQNLNGEIKRINKESGDIEDLNLSGYRLNVYKNYLYYAYMGDLQKDEVYYLYRIDLDKIGGEPELVLAHLWIYNYQIANDLIYFYPIYPPGIFSMDINDFSRTTEYNAESGKYFIAGVDEKYRYIIEYNATKTTRTYTLAKCAHEDTEFEDREYLFDIEYPEWADLRFNDFLAINGDFAYYCFNFAIYRCELKAGAKSEVIYEIDYRGDDRFNVIAVTDDGVYIKKIHTVYYPVYEQLYGNHIYRLDHDGENETALDYPSEVSYFVSSGDGKLRYIENDKIHAID
ncbi:MAG: hypothetical protein FWD23_04350 [Oscillospiraceae bacterium]|nr:hypothetical protein [Oscillospiraceae bacterium]